MIIPLLWSDGSCNSQQKSSSSSFSQSSRLFVLTHASHLPHLSSFLCKHLEEISKEKECICECMCVYTHTHAFMYMCMVIKVKRSEIS